MKTIGVLGAGTWGMALARMLCNAGYDVVVWSALEKEIDDLSATRKHPKLPEMQIPDALRFTKSIEEACTGKDILMFAVPSVYVRSTAAAARPWIPDGQIIVDVAKGIEPDTLMTMSEVIQSELEKEKTDGGSASAADVPFSTGKNPFAGKKASEEQAACAGQNASKGPKGVRIVALSGPTHAEEVAMDLPTTIVSACEDAEAAELVQDVFMGTREQPTCMRVYTNTDIKGVELCGALKNVIALASGISTGLGYGDNARAALITRGLAEITRLGVKMGCKEQTFYGLAGMGDLIVTATSRHSRNNKAGYLIGRGCTPTEAADQVGMVVEGINALPAAVRLAVQYGVEMPIVAFMDGVIRCGADPTEAVGHLMGRRKKAENPSDEGEPYFARLLSEAIRSGAFPMR
ncbi:MAG: NAD(P)-dependent glycerol-3-phosphate dehydrogenase [Sarcina sp.]|nr:NAD(P)-dependent glycerol-3-phosphate dehydrogenase [Sarcina sp.]